MMSPDAMRSTGVPAASYHPYAMVDGVGSIDVSYLLRDIEDFGTDLTPNEEIAKVKFD